MEQDNVIGPSVLSAPGAVGIITHGASTVAINLSSISGPSGFAWQIEGTVNGTNWFFLAAFDPTTVGTYVHGSQTALTGQYVVPCSGMARVRFHLTAIGAGSAVVSLAASQGVGPVLIAGGTVALAESAINLVPVTTGGLSATSILITADTADHVIKASPGQLYGVSAFNNNSSAGYLKIYNAVSATAGAGTPADRIYIPQGTTHLRWENGVAYGTGIAAILTTGYADADTTAPSATQFIVNFYWK